MPTQTATNLYEEVLKNMRKASEASLKMQQDMLQQWTVLWPVFPSPQSAWLEKVRDFQRKWDHTIADLARKHRDTMDRQYQAAVESLEEALRVSESTKPDEFRNRIEQLCRKTMDCMREVSEAQMQEFQEGVSKWSELLTKTGS